MTIPGNQPVSVGYWSHETNGGWKYLLPPLQELSIACLSARPSWAVDQASLFGELSLLHDSKLIGLAPQSEVVAACRDKARSCSVDSLLGADAVLPAEQRFDGLLIHDPQGNLLHRGNLRRISQLLLRLPAFLRPGAFVYLGVRNPHSLSRLIALADGQWRSPSLRLSKALEPLRRAGFDNARVHAYLTSGTSLVEVIPQRGYRASKNRERLAERVKELAYGRVASRVLAPAYGIVAFAGPVAASTLDLVLNRVATAPYFEATRAPVVKNYLLFQGSKAIVTLGPEGTADHDLVAILTSDELAIERRRIEAQVLLELAKLPEAIAKRVPRALDRFVIGRSHCFVLSRLPGVTLDVASDVLDIVTEQALDFAINLHRTSSRQVLIDEANYRRFFGALIEAARLRNPTVASTLAAWDAPLRQCVMGKTLPVVWMHGDYKVENVMYDQARRRLTGVIDWELAQAQGLPLLDPLYLLFYNRLIRGEDHLEALRQLILLDRQRDVERSLLRRYGAAVKVPSELTAALCCMFVAHHVGCRMHYLSGTSLGMLATIVKETLAMLERAAAAAHPAPSPKMV